jgi:peptidoglycan/LPS O-acetylase OafA/YrhL
VEDIASDKVPTRPASLGRLSGVEGIRGLACITILVVHVALTLPKSGVDPTGRLGQVTTLAMHSLTMFFVLSGFLLYIPFVRHVMSGRPTLSTSDYYLNRVLRIAPGYLVIFPICALVLGSVVIAPLAAGDVPASVNHHFGRMTNPGDFLLNLSLLQGYVPSGVRTGLMVSWSLVPEIGFYLVLPLLALIGARLARRIPPFAAMLIPPVLMIVIGRVAVSFVNAHAALAAPADREALLHGHSWYAVINNSLLGNAHILGIGMGVAVFLVAAADGTIGRRVVAGVRGLSALILLLILVDVILKPVTFGTWTGSIVCGAFLAWVMLPASGRLRSVAHWCLDSPPVQFLGKISYSLYLWHFPLVAFALLHFGFMKYDSIPSFLLSLAVVLVAAISLSWVTYTFIEAPALRRKRVVARPASTPAVTTPSAQH